MAVTYIATGTIGDSAAATLPVAYPAGLAAGDILLLQAASTSGSISAAIPDPSGWTNITSQVQATFYAAGVWLKVATGSESGTLSVATSFAGTGAMHAFRGADNTTPQDAAASVLFQTAGAATAVFASVTAATTGALPVWLGSDAIGARTATSTGTEILDGGTHCSIYGYYDTAVGAPGATGSRTVTYGGGNTRSGGALVLLRPAGGGGGGGATNPIMMVV